MPSSQDYSKLTVDNLRKLLKKRKLDTAGVKKVLIDRLLEDDASSEEERPRKEKKSKKDKKVKKPSKKSSSEEVEESDESSESVEEEPPKKMKVHKSPKSHKSQKKKKVSSSSSSTSEEDESDHSSEAEVEEDESTSSEVEKSTSTSSDDEDDSSTSSEEPPPKKSRSAKKDSKSEKKEKRKSSSKVNAFKTATSKKEKSPDKEDAKKEGIFGTKFRVEKILCENEEVLNIFHSFQNRFEQSPKNMDDLIEEIFNANSLAKARSILTQFIGVPKDCSLNGILKKNYEVWLSKIVDDFIDSLTLPTTDVEPKFDSALGIYRIGPYAFLMDPKTMSTALVFAYISDGKIVPLSAKTLKECPKEYTLYHEHHQDRSPPSEKDIRKIIDLLPYPREKETNPIDTTEDGVSFNRKSQDSVSAVESDLAAITIPKPDKKTFLAYRKAQQRLKSTNFVRIAREAGISDDDAHYIAQNYNDLSNKYL